MTTANIVMSVILIILMGVAVVLILRYMRKSDNLELLTKEFEQSNRAIMKARESQAHRERELNERESRLNECIESFKHVGYSVTIDYPEGTAPDEPTDGALKRMKSGIGYKTVPAMKQYIKRTSANGKTRYSLDILVMPDKGK